jgi:CheY-like chemotaxis protein
MVNNCIGYGDSRRLILLAEDDALSRKVTLSMLEHLGYHADIALNGIEVLQALENKPYDMVLMNIGMPLMDGFEATRQIRKVWKNGLKIVAITARVLPGIRTKCLVAGMDDCIGKPVKLNELAEMLAKHSSILICNGQAC